MSTTNYRFPDGGIYCGELNAQKLPEGKGTCEWPDGSKYDGYWVDGKKHGTGLMISAHETIKGFWYEDDLIHVFSKESSQEQDSKPSIPESYVGETNSENKPHGKGKYTYSDGSTYDGYWANGVKHGSGTQCDANGNIVRGFWYEGELLHTFSNLPTPSKLPKNQNSITALLIGNDYPGTESKLPNCVADVVAVGQKLKNIGADVTVLKNATESEMLQAINDFAKKDKQHDNALFYFSGHGEVRGPFHMWFTHDGKRIWKELHLLFPLVETNFKNLVLISDACNVTRPIGQDELDDETIQKIFKAQNTFNNRNLISAYSSLDGQSSFAVGDHKNGMYALAIMEYLEQPNIPLVKMFSLVNQFVVDYAQREFGGLVEVPHADFTRFDEDFCLYAPISEE